MQRLCTSYIIFSCIENYFIEINFYLHKIRRQNHRLFVCYQGRLGVWKERQNENENIESETFHEFTNDYSYSVIFCVCVFVFGQCSHSAFAVYSMHKQHRIPTTIVNISRTCQIECVSPVVQILCKAKSLEGAAIGLLTIRQLMLELLQMSIFSRARKEVSMKIERQQHS